MQEDTSKKNAPSSNIAYSALLPHHVEVRYGRLAFGGDPQLVMFAAQNLKDKKWEASGSGFPVLHKGVVSIVTAGHVAAALEGKVVVLKGPEGSVVLKPQQCRMLFNEGVDLAIITIPSPQLATLFGVCICIELEDNLMSVADSNASSLYQVMDIRYPKISSATLKVGRVKAFVFLLARRRRFLHGRNYWI